MSLVAVRRCLYGDGFAAHLLYRLDGEPVSLFIMPGLERPADEVSLLGHDKSSGTTGTHLHARRPRGPPAPPGARGVASAE